MLYSSWKNLYAIVHENVLIYNSIELNKLYIRYIIYSNVFICAETRRINLILSRLPVHNGKALHSNNIIRYTGRW